MRRLACGLLLGGLLAVGCTGGKEPTPGQAGGSPSPTATVDAAALRPFYEQQIAWATCEGGFQCAKVRVPLDYAKPDGQTIELAVIRKQATDQGNRIGSLLFNPG